MDEKELEENPDVPESVPYENFLESSVVVDDEYTNSLESFFGEKIEVPVADKPKKSKEEVYKTLRVHFTDIDAIANFSELIGQILYRDVYETFILSMIQKVLYFMNLQFRIFLQMILIEN